MSPLLHQYRNSHRFSTEHRLVFKVAGIESGLTKTDVSTLTADETLRELSKDVTEDKLNELSGSLKAKFNNDEQKIEDALQTMERNAPAESAEKKALIEYNMLRLRERIGIGTQTELQKELLKKSIAEKKAEAEAAKKPETLRDRMNGALEQLNNGAVSITDNLLPESLTKDWTREGKMTAGYVMGAGIGVVTITIARWLWRKGSNAFAAGKSAADQAGGSWLKKAAIAAAVGTAAFLGYKYFKGELSMEKITDAAKKGLEKAKEELGETKQKVADALHPWNAVGLEEESYNRAKEIYLSERDEGEADIKKIFNLKGDETNDQYEKFMEKMRAENPEYVKNGITYVRADHALESYKNNIGNAISILRDMSEAHWAEILGTTAVLSYFNIITLKTILNSTESVFVIARNLAGFLLSCGGKMSRNPIVSLFVVGGTCGTLYAGSKTTFLPKNLGELARVSKTNQKIIQGKSKEITTIDADAMESSLRKNAVKLEGIEENTDSWIQTKITDLLAAIKEKAVNGFALTNGETIEVRTTKGIRKLSTHLERKLSSALYSGKAGDNKKVEKYRAILDRLATFEKVYIENRCGTDMSSTLPESEYAALCMLLTDDDIGISIGIDDDIVWWNDADRKEKWALCVDPAIKDQNKIHKISANMRQDESDMTYGIARMFEYMRENTAPVVQATGGALSEAMKIGEKGMEVGSKEGGRLWKLAQEIGERDIAGSVGALLNAGGGLIWDGAGFVAFIGTEMVRVPSTTTMKLMGWIETQKNENMAVLWGASGVAYFVGKGTYNLIMAGKYSGIVPMNLKELGWAAVKMAPGPFAAFTDNLGNMRRLGSKEGREILKMRYISQTTPAAIARWFGDVFGTKITTSPGMERAIERWNQLRKELNLMKATHRNKFGRTYTEVDIENQKTLIEKQVEKIKNGLEEMAKGDIDAIESPMIRQVIQENLQGLGNPNDFVVKMDEVQIKYKKAFTSPSMAGESAAPGTSIIPDDLEFKQPETPTSTTESSPQNKPSNTEDVTSNGPAVDPAEAAKQAARAEKVEKVLKINRIAKVLEEIKDPNQLAKIREILNALSPEEVDAIMKSRKAVNLLKGSLQAAATTGDAVELTHIVTAAKNAQVLRVRIGAGWNGVGVVGDLFGAYMAYCDWQANNDRITSTDNPALKELYSTANYLYAAEGGSSVAGIVLGGISFLPSTNAVSVALGAPTGFVMLPIAALVMAARETHQGLEKSAEYHLLDERDLLKQYSPGQILQHISSTTPLSNLNWQQDWLLNPDSAREGNEGARNEGYRAYFAQIASATLPPVDAADADVDASMSDEQKQSAIDTLQRERISGFVYDAMAYIAYKTDKEFTLASPEVLHNAALYAEMQFDKRENGETTKSPAADDKAYWISMDTVISERALGSYKKITESISNSSKDAELFEEDLPAKLLYLLRDDLAACELKILQTDYSNWSTWSAWAQWKGDDQMRSVARGIFADQTWDVLHAAVNKVRNGKELAPAEIDSILADIKKVLRQNPDSVARNTLKTASNVSYFEKIGASNTRLSAPGMQDLMRIYTLSKPTALRVNQSKAFSMKSLEYHYKELLSHKNKHPIELIVPAGSSAGYLQIDEPLWMSDGGAANNYKPVGYSEGSAILRLEAGHYYSFRRQASMQVRDDYEAENTWEPKNGVGPDIEIITIDPNAPKEKEADVVTSNPNGPSF